MNRKPLVKDLQIQELYNRTMEIISGNKMRNNSIVTQGEENDINLHISSHFLITFKQIYMVQTKNISKQCIRSFQGCFRKSSVNKNHIVYNVV